MNSLFQTEKQFSDRRTSHASVLISDAKVLLFYEMLKYTHLFIVRYQRNVLTLHQ